MAGGKTFIGQPNIAIATIGLPPIAYTSLIALALAMRPNSKGSSTIGIKKSVVDINAIPFSRSYTAASSLLLLPTKRFLLSGKARLLFKISSKTEGDILQPQPAP